LNLKYDILLFSNIFGFQIILTSSCRYDEGTTYFQPPPAAGIVAVNPYAQTAVAGKGVGTLVPGLFNVLPLEYVLKDLYPQMTS
jgi:hypothetical protein